MLQAMTGNIYWLARPHHEQLYDTLAAPVAHFAMADLCARAHRMEPGTRPSTELVHGFARAVFLCGVHRRVSQYYYRQAFLSSRDPFTFFEYLYHRIANLRYLSGLGRITRIRPELAWDDYLCQHDEPAHAAPGWKVFLDEAYVSHPDMRFGVVPAFVDSNIDVVYMSIIYGVRTLRATLRREFDRLRGLVPPDTILGWIDQLLTHDIPSIKMDTAAHDYGPTLSPELDELRVTLLDQQAAILREKGEFAKCVRTRLVQFADLVQRWRPGDTLGKWSASDRQTTHAKATAGIEEAHTSVSTLRDYIQSPKTQNTIRMLVREVLEEHYNSINREVGNPHSAPG